jgi:hypothetical protein
VNGTAGLRGGASPRRGPTDSGTVVAAEVSALAGGAVHRTAVAETNEASTGCRLPKKQARPPS